MTYKAVAPGSLIDWGFLRFLSVITLLEHAHCIKANIRPKTSIFLYVWQEKENNV